ncbi:uncharacterized protein LOC144164142 isoform X2 [Haemaphysalis longicornis]
MSRPRSTPLPKLCTVVDCPNGRGVLPATSVSDDVLPVFYHKLPAEESRRVLWLNAVPLRKAKLGQMKVCSRHFAPSDYERDPTLSEAFGVPYRRPKLSVTAVPSMTPQQRPGLLDSTSAAGAEMAVQEPSLAVDRPTKAASPHACMAATEVPHNKPAVQPSRSGVGHDKAVQAGVSPSGRSIGLQVDVTPREKCHSAVQTGVEDAAPPPRVPEEQPRWEIVNVYVLLSKGSPVHQKVDKSVAAHAPNDTPGTRNDTPGDDSTSVQTGCSHQLRSAVSMSKPRSTPLPKRCTVVDCPNGRRGRRMTSVSEDVLPVFYHNLPAEESRRALWLNALSLRNDMQTVKVCSRHFAPSDYQRDPTLSQAFGVPYMRPKLSLTAVPSMTPHKHPGLLDSTSAAR